MNLIERNLPEDLSETMPFEYGDAKYDIPVFFNEEQLRGYVGRRSKDSRYLSDLAIRMVTATPYNVWLAAQDFSQLLQCHQSQKFRKNYNQVRRNLIFDRIAISNEKQTRAARIAITTSGLAFVKLIPEDVAEEIQAFTGDPSPIDDHPEPKPVSVGFAEWSVQAACRKITADIFFSDFEEEIGAAKAVCNTCDVREPCLGEALQNRIMHGVWGGTDEKERKQILAREHIQKN